jgi:hypothetical protein
MVSRLILAAVLTANLTACATDRVTHVRVPEQRVSLNELRVMGIDCQHRNHQIAWLEHQMSLPREEPQHLPYEQDWARKAKQLMWQIRTECG